MPRVFLINPLSETVRKKGSLLKSLPKNEDDICEEISDFAQLSSIIDRAAAASANWVFVEGGDGTAHGVLTAFMQNKEAFETFPQFTLLPGGMTNQVASNIGLKRASAHKLKALMGGEAQTVKPTPLLHLSIEGGDDLFGFLFSSGAVPMATQYCKDKMHGRGIGGSAAVAATILKGITGSQSARDEMMPPTPLRLRVSGDKEETLLDEDHLGTLVTTLPGLMMGLDPFWGEGKAPLRLTYVRADIGNLLWHVANLWAGRKHTVKNRHDVDSFAAHLIDYAYAGPLVLDGEPITLPKGRAVLRATEPVNFVL